MPDARRRRREPSARTGRDPRKEGGADQERRRVQREGLAGPEPEHEYGAERRTDEDGQVLTGGRQRTGLLHQLLRRGLGDKPRVGGLKEGAAGPEQRLDDHHLGDRRPAGEDQDGEHRVQRRARQIAHDHDPVTRETIGPHAAEQQQQDQWQRLGEQDDPQVGRRTGACGDVERERDDHDLVADRARGLAQEQIAKIRVAQDAQVRHLQDLSTRTDAGVRPAVARTAGGERMSQRRC